MPIIGKGRPSRYEQELQAQIDALRAGTSSPASVLLLPAYLVADLPSAVASPNGLVRVIDNPQGTAQSNGTSWISDVDGSDLGAGNVQT